MESVGTLFMTRILPRQPVRSHGPYAESSRDPTIQTVEVDARRESEPPDEFSPKHASPQGESCDVEFGGHVQGRALRTRESAAHPPASAGERVIGHGGEPL